MGLQASHDDIPPRSTARGSPWIPVLIFMQIEPVADTASSAFGDNPTATAEERSTWKLMEIG